MYARLSLSDDPDALEMKENLRKSMTVMGFSPDTDMNYLFQEASSGFYNGIQDYVACYAYYISDPVSYPYADYRDCEVGVGSVQAFLEGNPTLQEEEGENFQLGLVWSINNNMSLSIDLYEVILERAVTREDPLATAISATH